MSLLEKQNNVMTKAGKIFLDEFPSWSVQHATKLVEELKNSTTETEKPWAEIINEDHEVEPILIDCLTGVHAVFLKLATPEGIVLLFGGTEKVVGKMSFWPIRVQQFAILAFEFLKLIKEKNKGEKDTFVASLEKFYKTDKAVEPLVVHLATVTTKFVADESKKFSDSPFLVAGLYRIIFKLESEQLDWLSGYVLEKAKH